MSDAELKAAGFCGQVERPVQRFRLVEEVERCLGAPDESLENAERLALHGLAVSGPAETERGGR